MPGKSASTQSISRSRRLPISVQTSISKPSSSPLSFVWEKKAWLPVVATLMGPSEPTAADSTTGEVSAGAAEAVGTALLPEPEQAVRPRPPTTAVSRSPDRERFSDMMMGLLSF